MASSTQNTSASKAATLCHIILTTSHIQGAPNSDVEKIRIPSKYDTLAAAKATAYSCLFKAGYDYNF
ncbi:hypothetical protein V500_10473 [Pseudogymnoascus sp. VKM F-4518 (FW-2643)]|nr:hypothetical protein V500_10473 [Pseudogymnoascus sp. VKM F-4518 (FW-2643)]